MSKWVYSVLRFVPLDFSILWAHLLKWEFQPSYRFYSWLGTIREQRRRILELLEDNPSLKAYLSEAAEKGFQEGLG